MGQQKGVIFYPEHVAVARGLLTDDQIGCLFLALINYAESGEIPDIPSKSWGVCFDLMRGAIDKNARRYAETCERNRRNIEKRWNNQSCTNEKDGIQTYTVVSSGIPTYSTHTNQTEQNQTEQKDDRRAKRFAQPSVEEVQAYCEERRNGVDAQRFVDFYTANGWKVGKNPMRDWKAAVRTWERSDSHQEKKVSSFADIYGAI